MKFKNVFYLVDDNGKRFNDDEYEYAFDSEAGVASVRKDGSYYFIDTKTGERIGNDEYQCIELFYPQNAKFAGVVQDGKRIF